MKNQNKKQQEQNSLQKQENKVTFKISLWNIPVSERSFICRCRKCVVTKIKSFYYRDSICLFNFYE